MYLLRLTMCFNQNNKEFLSSFSFLKNYFKGLIIKNNFKTMAKINIYFVDLNEEAQQRIIEEIKAEMKEEDGKIPTDEMIDDYINRNNGVNTFEI